MSAYPEYSYSEIAGQWDKSILIFIVGMLVASTLGREQKAASVAFTLIAATLALQMTIVVADFFYLWSTTGLPPFGEARLTGSRTGMSYVANLFMAIVLSNMIARGLASGAFLRTTVAAEIGGLALAMVCLIMAGARNGIFTAVMLIVIAFVFYVVSRRREMSGITRQTVAIAVIGAIAAIALVYGSLKTDKRWNVFLDTARVALTQAERPNWIYLETMGRRGVQEVAHQCAHKAHHAAREIENLEGFSLPFSAPFFNEFIVRAPSEASPLLDQLARERGIDGGIALSRFDSGRPNDFLVCVTEMNSREQIDALIEGLRSS